MKVTRKGITQRRFIEFYMKLDYARTSRILIALLFVIAGLQKLMNLSAISTTMTQLGVPLAPLATLIVIIIEIPVAISFAYGYRTKMAGYVLIGFTILATILVHRDFSQGINLVMALKNIAIIGGIMSAIGCACEDCTVHPKKKKHVTHHAE
jgi:putative oxidoreductase